MEVHNWIEVYYRGHYLTVLVEGVYDRRYDELDDVRIRKESGFPMSKRLEKALMTCYSDRVYEALYESL